MSIISMTRSSVSASPSDHLTVGRPHHDRTSLTSRLVTVIDQAVPALGFRPAARIPAMLDTLTAGEACSRLRDDLIAVTREALSNVARHAGAHSATVDVDVTDKEIIMVVADDGQGLGTAHRRSGLHYAQVRAERHGGSFGFTPRPVGRNRVHLARREAVTLPRVQPQPDTSTAGRWTWRGSTQFGGRRRDRGRERRGGGRAPGCVRRPWPRRARRPRRRAARRGRTRHRPSTPPARW
jgi:hypothetical protein